MSLLMALGVLVALVLLIACANAANLMTAQAASRARNGLGRRLAPDGYGWSRWSWWKARCWHCSRQAWGEMFAWWAAPFVVNSIGTPGNPITPDLPADWRAARVSIALNLVVTLLFGLMPALRGVTGQARERIEGRRRSTCASSSHAWVDCGPGRVLFVVLFLASLFTATLKHLSDRPLGFLPIGSCFWIL